jgi:hypothetical protein
LLIAHPVSNSREKGVRNHLCEAPEGPVPGKMVPDTFFQANQTKTLAAEFDGREGYDIELRTGLTAR